MSGEEATLKNRYSLFEFTQEMKRIRDEIERGCYSNFDELFDDVVEVLRKQDIKLEKWFGAFEKKVREDLPKAFRKLFSESETQIIMAVIKREVLGVE